MDAATRIEILKPGTFTSVEGQTVSYAQSDLQALADSYDPAVFASPLVVGHPSLDDPAYGWVDRLEVDGDRLVAVPRQVEPSFAELVRAGRYAKVSAQLYPADHPFSPTPGKPYLKHVGFLGAAAPAIKGLKALSFSEEQVAGVVTLDLELSVTQPSQQTPSFAEQQAALDARKAELDTREATLASEAATRRHAANVSFAEGLIAKAQLAPAGKATIVGVLDQLDALSVTSFGEGADKVDLAPAAALRKLLGEGQPVVSLGEHARRGDAPGSEPDPDVIAAEAQSFAEGEVAAGRPRPSMTQAVNHLRRARAAKQN